MLEYWNCRTEAHKFTGDIDALMVQTARACTTIRAAALGVSDIEILDAATAHIWVSDRAMNFRQRATATEAVDAIRSAADSVIDAVLHACPFPAGDVRRDPAREAAGAAAQKVWEIWVSLRGGRDPNPAVAAVLAALPTAA